MNQPQHSKWRAFRKHRLAVASGFVLLLMGITVAIGPMLLPHQPDKINLLNRFSPPSSTHWLGTDDLGRDVLARVLVGGRISLLVGLGGAVGASTVGLLVGVLAGLGPRWVDNLLMRFVDFMVSIPTLPLLLIVSRFFGGRMLNIILIVSLFSWMSLARVIRAEILSLKEREFVQAAHALGVSFGGLVWRHIIPNVSGPLIVYSTLSMGYAILTESSLSYLGLGIQPPMTSWGSMLMNAQGYLWDAPWVAIYPGLCILITLLAINFLGDGLRDQLNPQ